MESRKQIPFQGFIRRALGHGRLSPEGLDIEEIALHSGVRTRANWLVPSIAGVATVIALFLFRLSQLAQDGFSAAFFRIFLFDYLLFVFAWVSGWNMSRRWRENPELIEELSLTPIRPLHTTTAASSGLLGVWAYVIMAVFLADVVLFFIGKYHQIPMDGTWGAGDSFGLFLDASIISVIALPGLAALAVFHYQSVKLAHAMFSLGTLPRVPLGALAMNNFLLIAAYVVVLSMVGCMVAGIVWIPFAIVGAGLGGTSSLFRGDVAIEVSWILASIGGFWAVGLMKARIAKSFLIQFGRRWAMFTWWGAAELAHPFPYPRNYEAAATSWSLHQVADELNHAPNASKTERERARREYLRSLSVIEYQRRPPAPPGTIARPTIVFDANPAPPRMAEPLVGTPVVDPQSAPKQASPDG